MKRWLIIAIINVFITGISNGNSERFAHCLAIFWRCCTFFFFLQFSFTILPRSTLKFVSNSLNLWCPNASFHFVLIVTELFLEPIQTSCVYNKNWFKAWYFCIVFLTPKVYYFKIPLNHLKYRYIICKLCNFKFSIMWKYAFYFSLLSLTEILHIS